MNEIEIETVSGTNGTHSFRVGGKYLSTAAQDVVWRATSPAVEADGGSFARTVVGGDALAEAVQMGLVQVAGTAESGRYRITDLGRRVKASMADAAQAQQ